MRKRSWTEFQLKEAVKCSSSVRQVLNKLNLKAAGKIISGKNQAAIL